MKHPPLSTHPWLLALAAILFPLPGAQGEDTSVWADTRFAARWTDGITFFGATGFRWDGDSSSLARFSAQAGFDFRVAESLTVSPTFQMITQEPDGGLRADEYRFGLALATARRWDAWLLRGNFRAEYRHRTAGQDEWWLRPSIGVHRSLGPESWRLSGYSTLEGFVLPASGEWSRTRAFVGLRKTIFRDCDVECFYAREWNHGAGDPERNIVGIALRFLFDRRERRRPLVEGLLDALN